MVDPGHGPRSLSVAVIGAGAAGLVTARELLREGHQVTVFEQNETIGGIWNYQEQCEEDDLLGRDPDRRHVHSSMYSTLRTNLPRQVMSYSDFPFIPEVMGDKSHDSRRFPIHTEVLAWLGVFATTFDLMKHIHFNTIVTSLQPLALDARIGNNSCVVTDHPIRSRWQLKHSRVPARTTLQNKSAASASQQAAHPDEHIQSQPVTLTGQTPIHASAQAQPSACHSENGTAAMSQEGQQTPANSMASSSAASQNQNHAWANSHNSELDITAGPARDESSASSPQSAFNSNGNAQPASDAHHHDHQQEDVFDAVICCVGNYHQPNLPSVDGIDSFPGLQMHAHNYRTNAIFAGKRVMVIGSSFSGEEIARLVANVAAHVYHSARSFPKQATPRSNLTRVAMLCKIDGKQTATLQDGSELEHIDAVVYCTGYQYAYPFLEGTGLIRTHDMRVDPLWMHIFPPSVAPTLAFVGLLWKSLRNWQFQLQAKLVARVLSGRSQLPSTEQMKQDIDTFYKLLQDRDVPVRYTHDQEEGMPVDQFVYNAELARLCGPGAKTHPEWIKSLYVKHVGGNILRKPDTFRDTWDDVELETFAKLDELCAVMLTNLRKADSSSQTGL